MPVKVSKTIKQDLLKTDPVEPSLLNVSTSHSPAASCESPLVQEDFPHPLRHEFSGTPTPLDFIGHTVPLFIV